MPLAAWFICLDAKHGPVTGSRASPWNAGKVVEASDLLLSTSTRHILSITKSVRGICNGQDGLKQGIGESCNITYWGDVLMK